MDDALLRNVVERIAIARRTTASSLRHFIGRRQRHITGQGLLAEQRIAATGTAVVVAAPDFLRPVRWFAVRIQEGADEEVDLCARAASDPIALHFLDALGPVHLIKTIQESLSIGGDAHGPLF